MDVLILDADVPVAELMETLVSGLFSHARIQTFRNLADARASLDQISPDLVVCEWDLPDGRGLDLVRAVRQRDRDVPVLMLSARADRDKVMAAARFRIQGFVPKPFSANAMQQRLQALLPRTLLWRLMWPKVGLPPEASSPKPRGRPAGRSARSQQLGWRRRRGPGGPARR